MSTLNENILLSHYCLLFALKNAQTVTNQDKIATVNNSALKNDQIVKKCPNSHKTKRNL